MKFNRKILLLIMFIGLVSLIGAYSASVNDNAEQNFNESDFGCCSIVWQLDGNNTLFSHRRDSNLDATIHIENVDWHGHKAIKQYKTDNGYFSHVIVTDDGWVIGFGGIDDGENSEIIENITAEMINSDNSISTEDLTKIQEIKKPYGRGHVLIKAPNGNYGFATIDKVKTGKLEPGQYISIPNDYQYSRADNISLDGDDKIGVMDNLSRSDLYGEGRREIVIYDFQVENGRNTTDIYASNEDGYYVGVDNSVFIDDIYVNDTLISGKDIPIAPNYKSIGSFSFGDDNDILSGIPNIIKIIIFLVIAGILIFVLVKFINGRRKHY